MLFYWAILQLYRDINTNFTFQIWPTWCQCASQPASTPYQALWTIIRRVAPEKATTTTPSILVTTTNPAFTSPRDNGTVLAAPRSGKIMRTKLNLLSKSCRSDLNFCLLDDRNICITLNLGKEVTDLKNTNSWAHSKISNNFLILRILLVLFHNYYNSHL